MPKKLKTETKENTIFSCKTQRKCDSQPSCISATIVFYSDILPARLKKIVENAHSSVLQDTKTVSRATGPTYSRQG